MESRFEFTKSETYSSLKIFGNPNDTKAQEYLDQVLAEILNAKLPLVVNCEMLVDLNRSWIRCLTITEQKLKEISLSMRWILVNSSIQKMFVSEGLSRIFRVSANLRDALLSLGVVHKKALDVGFINPFLDATLKVLEISAETQAKPGAVFVKKNNAELSGDISGVIGMVSDSFNGNVIITFPEQTFLNIISKMLGEEVLKIDQATADGAAELTNMIFGQAKVVLNEKGYGLKTALPSVITGRGHSFSSKAHGPVMVVPFDSTAGKFFVEIGLSDAEPAAA